MNRPYNEDHLDASHIEGFKANTNELNSAVASGRGEMTAPPNSRLARYAQGVQNLTGGDYLVSSHGYTFQAPYFDALHIFTRRLGVCQ
jgi:hypothetical protein